MVKTEMGIQWGANTPPLKDVSVEPLTFTRKGVDTFKSGRALTSAVLVSTGEVVILAKDVGEERIAPQPEELLEEWLKQTTQGLTQGEAKVAGTFMGATTFYARIGVAKPIAVQGNLKKNTKARSADGQELEQEDVTANPVVRWEANGIRWSAWLVRAFDYDHGTQPETTMYEIAADGYPVLIHAEDWGKGLKGFMEWTKGAEVITLERVQELTTILIGAKSMKEERMKPNPTKALEQLAEFYQGLNHTTRNGANHTAPAVLAGVLRYVWEEPKELPHKMSGGVPEDVAREPWKKFRAAVKMLLG